jgi:NADH dehydrogenase
MRLRNHVLSCLEMAARAADPGERRAWLTFVVAGGGPTGVEYAGALGELLRLVMGRDYPELSLEESRIVLVEGRTGSSASSPRASANTHAAR